MTIPYPHIPPVIFAVGPVAVRWYGVMYGVGYLLGYRLARTRTARLILPIDRSTLDAWIGYLVIGMLIGARLVYAAVYDRPAFVRDPLELLRIWHGGLSFHGDAARRNENSGDWAVSLFLSCRSRHSLTRLSLPRVTPQRVTPVPRQLCYLSFRSPLSQYS